MSLFERFIELYITVILIFGGYSWYFWAQRQRWRKARYLETRFDAMVGYDPRWVWVYSGLYYPMILVAAWSIDDWRSYALAVGCFLMLLAIQIGFFLFAPVEIPAHWRTLHRGPWEGSRSQRFLDLVWSYDKLRNSMPSMHVSVAMMVDLTIWRQWPLLGHVCTLFPFLIAVSALKTKQHYVVDVVPGALTGAAVFFAWNALIA